VAGRGKNERGITACSEEVLPEVDAGKVFLPKGSEGGLWWGDL